MKRINKTHPPPEFDKWFNGQPSDENGRKLNCKFGDIPGDVKAAIKQSLLKDQGSVCCYTGIRIKDSSSHIEHVEPQDRCTEYRDIDYNNLLAAFPKNNTTHYPFGAHRRMNWYDEELFVHPLRPDVDAKFRYSLEGEIQASNSDHHDSLETIKRLSLDHPILTEWRKQAIDELLFPENHALSERQANIILQGMNDRDRQGYFRAFYFVLQHACVEYIRRLQKRRKR